MLYIVRHVTRSTRFQPTFSTPVSAGDVRWVSCRARHVITRMRWFSSHDSLRQLGFTPSPFLCCGVLSSSVRPKSSRFRFNTASRTSFRIAAIGFGCMGHVCKLAVRPDVAASISSNITFAACFGHRCVPNHCEVAPVSTQQVSIHSGLLPSVF